MLDLLSNASLALLTYLQIQSWYYQFNFIPVPTNGGTILIKFCNFRDHLELLIM